MYVCVLGTILYSSNRKSWDSIVGIATSYRLDNQGVKIRVQVG
jgi:hypothetical protein